MFQSVILHSADGICSGITLVTVTQQREMKMGWKRVVTHSAYIYAADNVNVTSKITLATIPQIRGYSQNKSVC